MESNEINEKHVEEIILNSLLHLQNNLNRMIE